MTLDPASVRDYAIGWLIGAVQAANPGLFEAAAQQAERAAGREDPSLTDLPDLLRAIANQLREWGNE